MEKASFWFEHELPRVGKIELPMVVPATSDAVWIARVPEKRAEDSQEGMEPFVAIELEVSCHKS